MLLVVVVPLLLAEPLARVLCQQSLRNLAESRRAAIAKALASLTLVAGLTGIRLAHAATTRDGPTSPVSALAYIPPELRAQPVFNDYAFGGLLMLEGIKPFIDGRSELYGDDFVGSYLEMMHPDRAALEQAFRRYEITWTLLVPASPAVAVLDMLPGWRRFYADRFAVVYVREDAGPEGLLCDPAPKEKCAKRIRSARGGRAVGVLKISRSLLVSASQHGAHTTPDHHG
jgi:hypothetical protein